jgi:hypothetical protein
VMQMSSAQYDQYDVEKTLKAEYKLMCLADTFKALFDDHFDASHIKPPGVLALLLRFRSLMKNSTSSRLLLQLS